MISKSPIRRFHTTIVITLLLVGFAHWSIQRRTVNSSRDTNRTRSVPALAAPNVAQPPSAVDTPQTRPDLAEARFPTADKARLTNPPTEEWPGKLNFEQFPHQKLKSMDESAYSADQSIPSAITASARQQIVLNEHFVSEDTYGEFSTSLDASESFDTPTSTLDTPTSTLDTPLTFETLSATSTHTQSSIAESRIKVNESRPAAATVNEPQLQADSKIVYDAAIEITAHTRAPPTPIQSPSTATQGTTDYLLAGQPKIGDRYKSETPVFDSRASEVSACLDDFSPDPIDEYHPYDPYLNQQVYQGKQLNATQRPLLELGQPWYQLGQLSPGYSFLGHHNNVNPQFLIFGDFRQAIASNTIDGDNVSQFAWELNTFWSFFLTGTERLVTGVSPFDNGVRNTSWLLDDDRFDAETDFDFDFGYLEGDLGAITGGIVGETLPFDLPFAAGLTPIFIQNGIWINDALEGLFFTIPARNSPRLNISNMDVTFAYIYDQINSAAFGNDNSAAKAYAFFLFVEALNGYIEADYAFLEDRSALDRSYHNISLAYSRRFGRFLSNSTRIIANAGQVVTSGDQTADGVLLLSENSLITRNPYTVIPYFNFFAGFDSPQSFAGDQELVNTGILFESDGMTGYPTLDGRGQDTFGYGIGLNLLAQDFSQQLILETAAVFRNDDSDLAGDQFGIGMRYQLPLSNSWIFRSDSMFGFFRDDEDDFGMRMELRKKF